MGEERPVARPWWVKVTLWGLRSRASALFYVWFCVAVAIGFALLGFRNRWYSIGAVWIVAAVGYLRAIRWIDEHGGWS
jgi:hypothetical protein